MNSIFSTVGVAGEAACDNNDHGTYSTVFLQSWIPPRPNSEPPRKNHAFSPLSKVSGI